MNRIFLYIIIIVMCQAACANTVNLDTVIGHVAKAQMRKSPIYNELNGKCKFNFSDYIKINQTCDTIFIRESISEGSYGSVSVWNKRYSISVDNIGTDYETIRPLFWNQEKKYISEWNTSFLSGTNAYIVKRDEICDGYICWATRIIIHNGFASFEIINYRGPIIE